MFRYASRRSFGLGNEAAVGFRHPAAFNHESSRAVGDLMPRISETGLASAGLAEKEPHLELPE